MGEALLVLVALEGLAGLVWLGWAWGAYDRRWRLRPPRRMDGRITRDWRPLV